MQTKKHSVMETLTQTAIGYLIALCTQWVVYPLMGIPVSLGDNLLIGLIFTGVSLVKGYILRRFFTKRTEAGND